MDLLLIFTKTAKGILDLKSGTKNLSYVQIATLQRVDGRSSVAALTEGMSPRSFENFKEALKSLEAQGAIKVFTRTAGPVAIPAVAKEMDADDLPLIEIEELSPEEGVRAWAEARRGARDLSKHGFMTTAHASGKNSGSADIRLLIVEDDESIAQLMQTYLMRRGFLTQVASDGMVALEMLEQEPPPDLVLLDVNLPVINGFDVLQRIRAHPQLHSLPAIMVTAQVSEADVLRGLNGGADGYIFKPFEWSALHDCISQVLGIRAAS